MIKEAGNDAGAQISSAALIIDVRTRTEFATGHAKGALNIPLHELHHEMKNLDETALIITCCASGIRSEMAKNLLRQHGFTNVHNGGAWTNVAKI